MVNDENDFFFLPVSAQIDAQLDNFIFNTFEKLQHTEHHKQNSVEFCFCVQHRIDLTH